jgi:hypothetical protein
VKVRDAVTPVSLVVLAAAAVGYAYVVDRKTVPDTDRAARHGDAFPSFRVDQVARVELDGPGQSLVLERDPDAGGAAWLIASPRRERADSAAVDALIRELELAKRVRDVTDREAVGLAEPRVRGRVTIGPLEVRFLLGGDAPYPEGAAYMRLEGEGSFVVGRSLAVQLLRGVDAYRDRMLVPYGAADTARVDVAASSGGGDSFAIERRGASFRVVGSGLRASRGAVDQLFAALGDTRAEAFLDDAQADRARAQAPWSVSLSPRTGDRPPVELRIGGECPGQSEGIAVVREQPSRVAACAPRTIALALEELPRTMTDTSPLYAHADEFEELRLEPLQPGGPAVDLARKDHGWHERGPEERDLDPGEAASANSLAAALAGARGTEARPATPEDRFAAHARARIVRAGDGVTEIVDVGPAEPDGSRWMRREDDGAILRVPLAAARRFWPQAVSLRGRNVWEQVRRGGRSATFDAASVVAIDDSCGPTAQRLELRNAEWRMRRPSGFRADARAIAELIETFGHAHAQAWVADADDGTFGLGGADACTVTFSLDDGTEAGSHRGIAFGATGDGGIYARDVDDKAIFVAPAALRDAATRPAVDRTRMRIDPTTLERATLVSHGRRITLERGDVGGDLAGALASLTAQEALHVGPPAPDEGFSSPTLEIRAAMHPDTGPLDTHIVIGATTRVDGSDAYFARVSGVDATFAVPRRAVSAILDSW